MRSVSTSTRRTMLFASISCVSLTIASTAAGQAKTYHPTITGISTTSPTPGQTVTLNGSDLAPPTWTVSLQYHDRYGSGFHDNVILSANVTSSSITFSAPSNVRPDSIVIQYTNAGAGNAGNNPIPLNERRVAVPQFVVQEKPHLDTTGFASMTGIGGVPFRALAVDAHTLTGRFILGPLTGSLTTTGGLSSGGGLTGGTPTLTSSFSFSSAPTVTLGGTPVSVSTAKYVPTTRDEVVISPSTSIPHNTTGFLKLVTPNGADSVRLTFLQPPQNAHVFETFGASAQVTNGQLVRGRQYQIRGKALVPRAQVSANTINAALPTVTIAAIPLNLLNAVSVNSLVDTIVTFSVPTNTATNGGPLSLSHPGGTIQLGTFTVLQPPSPLQITGAVISPNDIIGGSSATITLSLSPAPTNFSTAGELSIGIPASLSGAINPISSVAITSNPMTITIPTKVIQTTATGNISVSHNTQGGGSANVATTVRPPRPTAVAVTPDSIAGGASVNGTVSFDLPGQATVLLSSSNPSVVTVPASLVRTGGSTATFPITSTVVTSATPVSISASLNGISVAKTIVVRPGRLTNLTPSQSTVNAGESVPLTVTFDAPVTNAQVTSASSDTALKVFPTSVTGTTKQFSANTTKSLVAPVSATLTATSGTDTKSVAVQINPISLTTFTVSPSGGTGGATLAATARLTRTAMQQQFMLLTSSDTSVATVANQFATFNIGEDVKIISILLKPQSVSKSATITVTLHANNNTSAASIINSKTITVTANP